MHSVFAVFFFSNHVICIKVYHIVGGIDSEKSHDFLLNPILYVQLLVYNI